MRSVNPKTTSRDSVTKLSRPETANRESGAPQAGDRISLQDGKMCEVRRTYFKVISTEKSYPMLVANVSAFLIENQK